MSLLAKYPITANAAQREVVYGKLISFNGSAPAIVNGEPKDKVHVYVQIEGEQYTRSFYMFRDSIYGLPTFVPKGGMDMSMTITQSEEINPADGLPYLNGVSMGVKA